MDAFLGHKAETQTEIVTGTKRSHGPGTSFWDRIRNLHLATWSESLRVEEIQMIM